MASDDIYIRKDVNEANQRAIIAEIQRGNAELLRVIEKHNSELNLKLEQYRNESKAELEQFKNEVSGKLEQYRNESKTELEQFKNEVSGKLEQYRNESKTELEQSKREVHSRFDKLEAQIVVLSGRVDGLEHRMSSLETFVTGGIGFIAMLITLVVFIMPVSRLITKLWKPKPEITLEQIEALIDAKLSARQ